TPPGEDQAAGVGTRPPVHPGGVVRPPPRREQERRHSCHRVGEPVTPALPGLGQRRHGGHRTTRLVSDRHPPPARRGGRRTTIPPPRTSAAPGSARSSRGRCSPRSG